MTLELMTDEERDFAAQYHDLVYKFLRTHRLPEDEYYDVVIFGYLDAVQTNFRNPVAPELQNFPALAYTCMEYKVLADWQRKQRVKRRGDYMALSMDAALADTDSFTFHDILPDRTQDTALEVENTDLIERIFDSMTKAERKTLNLFLSGYKAPQIAELLGVSLSQIYNRLYYFRAKARAIRDTGEPINLKYEYEKRYRDAHPEAYQESLKRRQRKYYERHAKERRAKDRTEGQRENQREYCRRYWASHKTEINARRRAQRAAKKAALNAPNIENGSTPPHSCESGRKRYGKYTNSFAEKQVI